MAAGSDNTPVDAMLVRALGVRVFASESNPEGVRMMERNEDGERRDAPAFTLETAAGEPVSLSDYRGRPVLLFFLREFT